MTEAELLLILEIQMIRERAFELYVARLTDGVEGSLEQDWAKAEADLGDPVETVGSVVVPGATYV